MVNVFNPVRITVEGCFDGDDFDIALELGDKGYSLRGKRISRSLLGGPPRVSQMSVAVSADWATGVLTELKNAHIPPLPPEVSGCDGEFYTMSVGDDFGGATYRWWRCPPEGWEVLSETTRRMIDEFSKHLPECSPPEGGEI